MLQQINQSFWKQWSSSYVADLQRRVKWKTKGSTLKLGTTVVLKNDNVSPCRWLLGRIIEAHPGLDGEGAKSSDIAGHCTRLFCCSICQETFVQPYGSAIAEPESNRTECGDIILKLKHDSPVVFP
ncbi:hypothetical protein D910_01934 [Dendroctonus ponderosae]|uniref:DUF5641 domain-containing protein n=1 Tax=Dendroctonus ponderosae TaxID=77166 RepID=U4TSL5_DENPD|nr:hypothetical protein D910_01934 [Dendroctonus ponderosae]